MDGIDEPLNNVGWLLSQFRQIRAEQDETARLQLIDKVLNRTNPGPGGFYDNMGSFSSMKRIANPIPWEEDPGTLKSPRIAFYYSQPTRAGGAGRCVWLLTMFIPSTA
jgi:hypothetical protein